MAGSSFSWAAAGDVGLGIGNAISAWSTASANATVASANADAQRVIRDGQNKERAAALSLAATVRSLSFHSALTNAGNADADAADLIARTQQAWTSNKFEMGLRHLEQLGAYTARAAAAGVGGASVQQTSYSVRLQQDRVAKQMDQRENSLSYELIKQRSGIMPATVSRLDVSPLSPNIDYTPSYAGSSTPNLGLSLIQGLLSKKDSLQVALDSIGGTGTTPTRSNIGPTLDHMDLADAAYQPITIN